LSYTTCAWGEPALVGAGTDLSISVDLTNTGDRAGSEVVQCYVAAPQDGAHRPPQELKGYAKLRLEPGATGTASVVLDRRSFSRWDANRHAWVVDPGDYRLCLGASSRDIKTTLDVALDGQP
jgi:beta-glucosidase